MSARRPRGAARCRLRYPAATGLTDPLERALQLCTGQPSRLRRCQGRLEDLVSLGPAEAVLPVFDGRESGKVVLAQQRSELVGDLVAGPGCVLPSAREDGAGAGQAVFLGKRPGGVRVGPRHVGRDQDVAQVGLLARDGVTVAASGGGHRIDREHLPLTGPQPRYRGHDLFGHHGPKAPRRADTPGPVRPAEADRAGGLRPHRRPGPRPARGRRRHRRGPGRRRGGRTLTRRPGQAGSLDHSPLGRPPTPPPMTHLPPSRGPSSVCCTPSRSSA